MSNTWFRLRRGFFLSFFPSDTPHYENVLPDGWCLTDIGELLINRDGERKPVSSVIRSKQTSKIYDYYGAAGVIDKVDSYLFDERLLLIGEDGANLLSRSKNNAFFAEGSEGGNLAASKIRNLECPSYEICLIDYGCGKFNRKIHIMEQYP